MNIFTYISYLKNNIYKNKSFFLTISIFTIFFFILYNFFIKKNYNLYLEVEFSPFVKSKKISDNFKNNLRVTNQHILNFGFPDEIFFRPNSTIVYKTDQTDVLVYFIRDKIKEKFFNFSYVRIIKSPSSQVVYKFKTGGNSLADIEEKKKYVYSEFKKINNLINENTLSIIDEMLLNKVDQEINKEINDYNLMILPGKYADNRKILPYQDLKNSILNIRNSLLLSNIDFVTIESSITENTSNVDFYYSALISILIWAITILIGNILILEHQLSKKNNIKKNK